MSELSKQIRLTFQNVIKVYQEMSSMLQDADEMMEKGGYNCLHPNLVGTERSKYLTTPQWWITPYAARYYARGEDFSLVKAISVLLVNKNCDPIDPLVLFGCVRLKESEDDKIPYYSYGCFRDAWFSWVTGREMNTDLTFSAKYYMLGGKVHAVSLGDVKDRDALLGKIVEPLLAMSLD